MKIDGQCHCGHVRYEAEIDPERVLICNCTDCQSLSGSAFRTVAQTRSGGFRLIAGEPRIYRKVSEAGAIRLQAFCPECGSPIYSTGEGEEPKVYSLRAGTIRQRAELVPRFQIWSRSALGWLSGLAEIPAVATQPEPAPAAVSRPASP